MTCYAQQSCTAGRSAFITGQLPFRTGLSKVGLPGADLGIRKEDPTIAELLKPMGYMAGQFGKNHLGDIHAARQSQQAVSGNQNPRVGRPPGNRVGHSTPRSVCHGSAGAPCRGLITCRCITRSKGGHGMAGSLFIPQGYRPTLDLQAVESAIKDIKDFFEHNLAAALNLQRVTAPLFVRSGTGINDDLNGVEQPVRFQVKEDGSAPVEIVQSLAKWKRLALARYGFPVGPGLVHRHECDPPG